MALLVLELAGQRAGHSPRRLRLNTHLFVWCVLGLGAALWSFTNAGPDNFRNWAYYVGFAAVCGAFGIVCARPLAPARQTLAHLVPDVRLAAGRRVTWLTGFASAILLAVGPSADVLARPREPAPKGPDLIAWFDAQPQTPLPPGYATAPVTVVTFIDYQCPACFAAEHLLRPLWAELSEAFGDRLTFRHVDFPLDRECNSGPDVPNLHPTACEAAVVMRMAARTSDPRDLVSIERWIWANQDTMNRRALFQAARELAGLFEVERLYEEVLSDVRLDAAAGRAIGIRATPRFWINGVVMPLKPVEDMRLLITHAVNRTSSVAVNDVRVSGSRVPLSAEDH